MSKLITYKTVLNIEGYGMLHPWQVLEHWIYLYGSVSSICISPAFLSSSFPCQKIPFLQKSQESVTVTHTAWLQGLIDHRQSYKEGMGWIGSYHDLHITGIYPWSKILDQVSKLLSTGWPIAWMKPVNFLPKSLLLFHLFTWIKVTRRNIKEEFTSKFYIICIFTMHTEL